MADNKYIIMIMLVLCSIIVNSIFLGTERIIPSDAAVYSQMGKNLASGLGYTYNGDITFIWPPMTSFLLSIPYGLFSLKEIYGHGMIILISALCLIPLFLIADKHFGRKVAVLSSVFFIINYEIIILSTSLLSDIPGLFFFLWSLYFFDKENYIPSAIFIGLMGLTRRTAAVVFIAAFFYLIIKKRWRTIIPFVLIVLLVISPYYGWVYAMTGSPFTSGTGGDSLRLGQQKSIVIAAEWTNDIQEENLFFSEIFGQQKISLIKFIWSNTSNLIKKTMIQAAGNLIHVIPGVIGVVLTIPLIVGLYFYKGAFKKKSLLFILAFFILFTFTYSSVRHLAVLAPLLIPYCAFGLFHMIRSYRPFLKASIVFFVLIIILSPSIFDYMFMAPEHPEWKKAGLWMGENLPPDSKVLSRKPQIPYYAGGMTWSHFPMALNTSIAYAKEKGYQYIIFDEAYTAVYRPEMMDLLKKDEVEGLELVYYDPTPLHQVKIWVIKDG